MAFKSVGGEAAKELRSFLLQREMQRRQEMLDALQRNVMLEREARAQNEARRQVERDAILDQRYAQQRQDSLTARADAQGERYLNSELQRQEREETNRQRNMDRADAAGNRQLDAELRRQDQDANRSFQASENEKQRANARAIAGMQVTGRGDKQTEGQRKTDGLLSRAQAARATADNLESSVSTVDLLAPSFLRSEKGQRYRQAAKQWIQSVLRDESGAAIGADEEASYFETYFRQPGDTAAVIRQKQEARDAAENAMAQKVGSDRGNSGGNGRSRYRVSVE